MFLVRRNESIWYICYLVYAIPIFTFHRLQRDYLLCHGHVIMTEKNTVPSFRTSFRIQKSFVKQALRQSIEWHTKSKKTGNRKEISATREAREGLVRWHWPRRPSNWLGMTESRDPASLQMMRSWDWGASAQPVSHDLGPSIKVVMRINPNWQPSQSSLSSTVLARTVQAIRWPRFNVFKAFWAERETECEAGQGWLYFTLSSNSN